MAQDEKFLTMQIVSDIHVEFWESRQKFNFIKPAAHILVLLGDIGCCASDVDFANYKRFINELLPLYKAIIIIAGNHEYWYCGKAPVSQNNTMQETEKKIKQFCRTSNKLFYLSNTSINMQLGKKKYLIAGCTLWSHIPKNEMENVRSGMNDYSYIYVNTKSGVRKLRPEDVQMLHNRSVDFIVSEMNRAKKNDQKLVVLTHHKPYILKDVKIKNKNIRHAYESELNYLLRSPIVLWAYGHTHIRDRSIINGVQLYSNPKGYPAQKTNFEFGAAVKI